MNSIIITTDSGCDLTPEVAQQYNIRILPFHVLLGSQDYLDGQLEVKELFDYFDKTGQLPTSAATNPYEYEHFFTQIQAENPGCTIVHIAYSAQTTSAFRNAQIGIQHLENVHLVDSYNISVGLGLICLETAKYLKENPTCSVDDIKNQVAYLARKTRFSALIYHLDFLKAGGRVSNKAFLVGKLLRIRPEIELIDGRLQGTHRYRGQMLKCVEKMMRSYLQRYRLRKEKFIFVKSHGLEHGVVELVEKIALEFGIHHFSWFTSGAVISVHSGPGAFALAGIEE